MLCCTGIGLLLLTGMFANRPDTELVDRVERHVVFVDIAIPHDENLV